MSYTTETQPPSWPHITDSPQVDGAALLRLRLKVPAAHDVQRLSHAATAAWTSRGQEPTGYPQKAACT